MEYDLCKVGNHVSVTSSSPFRGLRGTIRTVHTIATDCEDEEAFCFYQIIVDTVPSVDTVGELVGALDGKDDIG